MSEMRNAYKILVGKYEGKRTPRSPMRKRKKKILSEMRNAYNILVWKYEGKRPPRSPMRKRKKKS
jgi:hypothetical protein